MICAHGKDEREECAPCAAAWKRQHGSTYWRKVDQCEHQTTKNPDQAWSRREPMSTVIVDGNAPERILKGTCVQCGTATTSKGKR